MGKCYDKEVLNQTTKSSILSNLRQSFASGTGLTLKTTQSTEEDELQAIEQALAQALPNLPPEPITISAGLTKKENLSSAAPTEILPGVQNLEQELTLEISPEVESFVEHHENQADKLPDEIVIVDGAEPKLQTHIPNIPVIVLPIDQKVEKSGQNKSPKFSIRWLVEWSRRIIKKFAGRVIYRA